MDKLRKFLVDYGIIAIVVSISTCATNLWLEKQKAVAAHKLNDSTAVFAKANDLWEAISKLESEYGQLDELRKQQDIMVVFDKKPDEALQKKIDSKADEIPEKQGNVLRAISENSHIIGRPLFQHMTLYVSLLRGHYAMKDNTRRIRQTDKSADLSFMDKQIRETGELLYNMRGDVASTRAYALQQIGH